MDHFYKNIDGWFDFLDIYTEQVNIAQDGYHFVEIGAWLGCSTSYMAVEILNSGKHIQFDVVDTWQGSSNEIDGAHVLATETDIFNIFKENLKPVEHIINPIIKDSVEAAKLYKDNSLDFIFIDANHQHDDFTADVEAWYPKLKIGGYIGGHDYTSTFIDVVNVVNKIFGNLPKIGNSWLYLKNDK